MFKKLTFLLAGAGLVILAACNTDKCKDKNCGGDNGQCNIVTGECDCNPGYTGVACAGKWNDVLHQRTAPKDWNLRETIPTISTVNGATVTNTNPGTTTSRFTSFAQLTGTTAAKAKNAEFRGFAGFTNSIFTVTMLTATTVDLAGTDNEGRIFSGTATITSRTDSTIISGNYRVQYPTSPVATQDNSTFRAASAN